MLALALGAFAFTSCESDDGGLSDDQKVFNTLSFEDVDAKFDVYSFSDDENNVYNITSWSSLIPKEQYGDKMIYGSAMDDYIGWSGYNWCDSNNTNLYSFLQGDEPVYWSGGQVVSNYYSDQIEGTTFEQQLAVSTGAEGAAGHGGSANFCVHNGDGAWFSFGDGVERVVDHMWVTNTNYVLNSLIYGDGFAATAGEDSWLKIVATGYDRFDNVVGSAEFMLCDGKDDIVTDWEMFDLSKLGKVAYVEFSFAGSADLCGEWGLNTPKYFAFDDVAVRVYE